MLKVKTGITILLVIGLAYYAVSSSLELRAEKEKVIEANKVVARLQRELEETKQRVLTGREGAMTAGPRLEGEKVKILAPVAKDTGKDLSDLEIARFMAELRRREILNATSFIGYDGKLGANFRAMFHMNAEEAKKAQEAVNKALRETQEAAAAVAVVKELKNGEVRVDIPPFSAGADIYDELMGSMATILGPERYSVFGGLAPELFGDVMSNFGAEIRTMWLNSNATVSGDGTSSFLVRENRSTSGGQGEMSVRPFKSLDDVRGRYGAVADKALPKDGTK